MKRITWAVAAMMVMAAFPLALAAYEVPKDLVIKRPDKNPAMATWVGPVNFPHGKHAVLNACKSCHHEESDRTLGQFLPCTQCHNKPGTDDISSFYLAWHNDKPQSCLACHRRMRLEKKAMPPISCTRGCHVKPEGGPS